MPFQNAAAVLLLAAAHAAAQNPYPGVISPLAQRCPTLANATNVACVNNYAAAMPPIFSRASSNGEVSPNDSFPLTQVPDPSFELVQKADFIVFDAARGADILGSAPVLEHVFDTRNDSIHEAPIYVPELNAIIFSLPHEGIYRQQIISLNGSSPTIVNYTTIPPVYAVNGGKYYNGTVFWGAEASFDFPAPDGTIIHQKPGLYALDPISGNVTVLLNNYYGQQFNSPNDLWVDAVGDIWFTDSCKRPYTAPHARPVHPYTADDTDPTRKRVRLRHQRDQVPDPSPRDVALPPLHRRRLHRRDLPPAAQRHRRLPRRPHNVPNRQ